MHRALLSAIALMLVLEGVLPFLSPDSWRRMVIRLAQMGDHGLRIGGLISMLLGVGLLYLATH